MWAMSREYLDERGRFHACSVPGWQASWWFYEQGLVASEMTPSERLRAMCRYFRAVDAGWEPATERAESEQTDVREPTPRTRQSTASGTGAT